MKAERGASYRAGLVAAVTVLMAGPQPSFKGIWEPVNYSEDVQLNGVYFVTPDEGWATGGNGVSAGVLLHTSDAGDHWDVALGDPGGSQRPFYNLRFVDQTTGFVVQGTGIGDHTLLRTTDGKTWSVSGTVPQHGPDYRFISATEGVAATHNEIIRTSDAGRTWKRVFDCVLKVEVEGLTRTAHCEVAAFAFPSQTVGYGIGHSSEAKGLFVFKTEDGGATWTGRLAVPGEDNGREGRLFFTTERTGYVCTSNGKLFGTDDGGQSWTGLPGAACAGKADFLFADPEVGWTLRYDQLTWTTDGGRRWTSRTIPLPASVLGFSLPRRDRAYAVGDHGMAYRYRVVPVQTVVAKAIAAPAMPSIPTTLATDATQIDGHVAALDGLVQSATGSVGVATAGSAAGGASSGDVAGLPATSPFVSGCCGKRLSSIELVLKAVGSIVPDFLSKYKNMNLLAQGLRTAAALPELSDSLRIAFTSFRTAPDRSSATTALAGVKSILAGLKAAVDTALQSHNKQPGVSQ